jgi:hypothetical protein
VATRRRKKRNGEVFIGALLTGAAHPIRLIDPRGTWSVACRTMVDLTED